MFEGDKETFAQAVRNECLCDYLGRFDDADSNWFEMWREIIKGIDSPEKETVDLSIDFNLDNKLDEWGRVDEEMMDEDDRERVEFLESLVDRWRSDKEARLEAVETISKEVFEDLARGMDMADMESVFGDNPEFEKARLEIALSLGLNVEFRDEDGATLLHRCSSMDAASLLLEHGLDPRTKDNEGKTPADYARDDRRNKLASFFDDKAQSLQASEQEQGLRSRAGVGRERQRGHEMSL